MVDLFGEVITKKRLIHVEHGFDDFWKAYPAGARKVAKLQCRQKWARFECAENASHIIAHVEWLKTQPDWLKDGGAFICAPLVYLNQRRWEGWEPPPVVPKRPDALAQIKAHKGAPMPDNVRAKMDELRGKR